MNASFKNGEFIILRKTSLLRNFSKKFLNIYNLPPSTIVDNIEQILLKERENVLDTIPVTRVDSRLGWEASMEYQGDEECLNWKLRQLDHELNFVIPKYRKSINLKI